MDKRVWETHHDPVELLQWYVWGKCSERKRILVSVACCRRAWHLIEDPHFRRCVDLAERFADGLVDLRELLLAASAVRLPERSTLDVNSRIREAVWGTVALNEGDGFTFQNQITVQNRTARVCEAIQEALAIAEEAAQLAQGAMLSRAAERYAVVWKQERYSQAMVVRDLFGHLFEGEGAHCGPDRGSGLVAELASAIYDERRFEDMPILADALEEAGCTVAAILDHCRGPGPHVRGCWAVDLILGKS